MTGVPLLVIAVVLGIVEGLTEFLPVSSTGHLIVLGRYLDFKGDAASAFEVIIQLGAVLAVVYERRTYLIETVRDKVLRRRLAENLTLGFIPAAVMGLLFHKVIKRVLFAPVPVAAALLLGGLVMIVLERRKATGRVASVDSVSRRQAFSIGCFQVLALWPGTSRSASTILGGMGVGLTRQVATEFSFLLAIPTMFAATGFDLLKNYRSFDPGMLGAIGIAFVLSFVIALVTVKGLLRYVKNHTFIPFGWYRIGLALLILLPAVFGSGA